MLFLCVCPGRWLEKSLSLQLMIHALLRHAKHLLRNIPIAWDLQGGYSGAGAVGQINTLQHPKWPFSLGPKEQACSIDNQQNKMNIMWYFCNVTINTKHSVEGFKLTDGTKARCSSSTHLITRSCF